MKFTVSRHLFSDLLSTIQGVIPHKSALPVLNNVLLTLEGNTLTATGTDMDMLATMQITVEGSQNGKFTLPAKRLFSIIKELPGTEVSLELKDTVCTIKSGTSVFRIHGLPFEDFPPVNEVKGKTYSISAAILCDGFLKTAFSASRDETRYVLNGVFLKKVGATLSFVATDGRRLSVFKTDINGEDFSAIVPIKCVVQAQNLLEGDIEFIVSEESVLFKSSNITLRSKLIEGNFPNYENVIPKELPLTGTCDTKMFMQVLKRVSLLSSAASASVKCEWGNMSATLSSSTPDVGDAREIVPVKFDGVVKSAYNPIFLLEALSVISSPEITFRLKDEISPALFVDGGFSYLIMPIRVS